MLIAILLFLTSLGFATGTVESTLPDQAAVPVVGPEAVFEVTVTTLRGPSAVMFLPLMDAKTAAGEHVRLTVDTVGAPDVMVARLVSGESQIGVLPTNVAAQLYARGVPVQVPAAFLWGVMYVVSSANDIERWEDLRNRTVYSISPGSTPDVLLRYLLDRNGIDPENDVTIDYRYGHVELAQMVLAGQVETAVLPEPFVTRILDATTDYHLVLDFQTEYERFVGERYPQTAIVIRSDVFARHRDALDEALSMIQESMATVLGNPAGAVQMAAFEEVGLPAQTVLSAMPRLNGDYQSSAESGEAIRRYLTVLHDFDPRTTGGTVPDEDFFYR